MEQDENIKHKEKLRSEYLKRLRVLELQAAKLGSATHESVIVQIGELRDAIDGIDQELAAMQGLTLEERFAGKTTTPQSSNFVQIEIIVRDPYASITPEIRSATVRAIAALANISAEQVRLLSVMPGSTIYRLEMPKEAAETLMELQATNDPLLATLEIERIERIKYRTKRGAMADNNSGGKQAWVTIVVALIGLVGTLGAAYLSRQVTVAQLQPTIVAAQTEQAGSTQAPIVIEVTSPPVTVVVTSPPVTVVVTSLPVVVTSEPIVITSAPVVVTSPPEVVTATPQPPAPTPDTTPPDTVLNVGDTWKQGGVELKLKQVIPKENGQVSPDWFEVVFEYTNHRTDPATFDVAEDDNFLSTDNNQRKLRTCMFSFYGLGGGDCYKKHFTVQPEQTVTINPAILTQTGDPKLKDITIKVTISSITDARWHISITH